MPKRQPTQQKTPLAQRFARACAATTQPKAPHTNSNESTNKGVSAVAPLFEVLEPRVLYSADAAGIAAVFLPDDESDYSTDFVATEFDDSGEGDIDAATESETTHVTKTIVFIDSRVEDGDTFVEAWADQNVRFVVIDADDDALTVISATFADWADNDNSIDNVRIVSHGSSGAMFLGDATVDNDFLAQHKNTIQSWQHALADDARIQLFGCHVGEGYEGHQFLKQLAELTHADVSGSDDLTGDQNAGGDWLLEVSYSHNGELQHDDGRNRFDDNAVLANWTNTLATIQVSYRADDVVFANNIEIDDLAGLPQVSLRAAVTAANNTAGNDVIELVGNFGDFVLGDQSIDVGSNVNDGSLLIRNESGLDLFIKHDLNENGARIFTLKFDELIIDGDPNDFNVTISLEDGRPFNGGGGAILTETGTELTVRNVKFENNAPLATSSSTPLPGGAIYANGDISVTTSEFLNNRGSIGGAIYVRDGANFEVIGSTFIGNQALSVSTTAPSGGAIYSDVAGTITGSLFSNNTANGYGGAVYTSEALTVSGSNFDGNSAVEGGGVYSTQDINITGSTFSNHSDGGAVRSAADIVVSDSTFSSNTDAPAQSTGGALQGMNITVTNSVFDSNTATLYGGAVAAEVMYTVSDSHFEGNRSINSSGGALFSRHGGTVINSSFVNNSALIGSAIHNEIDGTVRIERSTFSDNAATTSATVGVRGDTDLIVKASTFADNTANFQTAGLLDEIGTNSYVTSSVFSNNNLNDGTAANTLNVASAGFNLYDETATPHEQDLIEPGLTLGPLFTITDSVVQARTLPANSLGINAGAVINDDADDNGVSQLADAHGKPLDGLPDIGALEVQTASSVVYWADADGKIWRSNPEFTNVNLVLDTATEFGAAHSISGISIDLNGPGNDGIAKLYWVDHNTGTVWQSAADGRESTQVALNAVDVNGNPFDVTAITLDADRNVLYLLHGRTTGHAPAIRTWQLSETGANYLQTIETPGGEALENPTDLHFNAATGRLFWTDGVTPDQAAANQTVADGGGTEHGSVNQVFATVKSMLIDGTDVQTHVTATTETWAYEGVVTNDAGNFLYFTESQRDRIYTYDLTSNDEATVNPSSQALEGSMEDITYLSTEDSVASISTEIDAIFSYDANLSPSQPRYDHPTDLEVITSVSTPDGTKPYLQPNQFDYTESDPPKPITSADIGINNPVPFTEADITFELLSAPTLNGTLAADGVPLNTGDTFTFAQNITYFNDTVRDQTVDVFQVQATNLAGDTSPITSFIVNIEPVDDAATLSIAPVNVLENEISTPLSELDFTINDEENGLPVQYTFTPPPAANGVQILVNGVAPTSNSFTQAELASGAVTVSAEDTIITPANASTPVAFQFDFVAQLDDDGKLSNSQPTQMIINVTPQDDAAVISATPNSITINEGEARSFLGTIGTFSDEESTEPLYFIIETAPVSTIARLELNGVRLNTGDTFTFNDILANRLTVSAINTDIADPIESTGVVIRAVTDPANPASDSNALNYTINVLAQNDKPQIAATDLMVDENDHITLSTEDLKYTDEEDDLLQHYELVGIFEAGTNVPHNEVVLLNDSTLLNNGDTFTQADLASGLMHVEAENAVITDNTPFKIDIVLKAVATTGATDSDTVELGVEVTPQNDLPRVTPTDQTVSENAITAIPSTTLGYSDEESDAATHYTLLSIPSDFGVFLSLNGVPLSDGDQVTTEDVSTGRFVIDTTQADVQPGATLSLVYSVTTVDGQVSEPATLNLNVLPVNDSATLSTPTTPLSVDEGTVQTLSTAHIIFADEEDNLPTRYVLQSLPTEPGVTLELNGVALAINDSFTQADLTSGLLTINASNAPVLVSTADSLTLFAEVDDGTVTNPATLNIQFNKVENTPTLTTTGNVIVFENQSTVLQSSQLTFADADGDTIAYYRIESPIQTDGFSVQRDGVELQVGDTFTQAELDGDQISIVSDGTDLSGSQTESLFIRAFADNNMASNAAPLSVVLQPEDDAPELASPDGVRAFENFITPLLSSALDVTDEEGDLPTIYNLVTPIPDTVGQLVLIDEPLMSGDTFTQADLEAGNVRIDLEDLDITQAIATEFTIVVEAGGLSSTPHTVQVSIRPMNDAPELARPIVLPTISQDLPATLPPNAFTDSDGDNITYSVGIVSDSTAAVEPLPAWVTFNPATGEFQLIDYARQEELTVQVMTDDSNGGRTPTNVVLRFDNALALGAAQPTINTQGTQLASLSGSFGNTEDDTPAVGAANPSEQPSNADAESAGTNPKDLEEFTNNRIPTDDIESSRIDLASLLPAMSNVDAVEAQEFERADTSYSELSQMLGFTADFNNPLSFTLNTFESNTYQRALTNLANEWDREEEEKQASLLQIDTRFGNSVGLSSGFTVGYMIWLLRGGTLMGSMLTSLPAWRLVDPLPILAELDDDLDDDQETLESMVSTSEPVDSAVDDDASSPTSHP